MYVCTQSYKTIITRPNQLKRLLRNTTNVAIYTVDYVLLSFQISHQNSQKFANQANSSAERTRRLVPARIVPPNGRVLYFNNAVGCVRGISNNDAYEFICGF